MFKKNRAKSMKNIMLICTKITNASFTKLYNSSKSFLQVKKKKKQERIHFTLDKTDDAEVILNTSKAERRMTKAENDQLKRPTAGCNKGTKRNKRGANNSMLNKVSTNCSNLPTQRVGVNLVHSCVVKNPLPTREKNIKENHAGLCSETTLQHSLS